MDDLVERLNVLRRELELRWTGQFVDNAVNTIDSAAARITALEAENARLKADKAGLVEALTSVMPFVATQSIGCHGDKCREAWCYSCNGGDDAEMAAMAGLTAKMDARAALEQHGGGK